MDGRNIFGVNPQEFDPNHLPDWVIDVGVVARRVGRRRGAGYLERALPGIIRAVWRNRGYAVTGAQYGFAALTNYFVQSVFNSPSTPEKLQKKRPAEATAEPAVKKLKTLVAGDHNAVATIAPTTSYGDKAVIEVPNMADESMEAGQGLVQPTAIPKGEPTRNKIYDDDIVNHDLELYGAWWFTTQYAVSNPFTIRLNSVYNPIVSTTSQNAANTGAVIAATPGTVYTNRAWAYSTSTDQGTSAITGNRFPVNFGDSTSEKVANRDWYSKLYDFYHVKKCHWELIIENPFFNNMQDWILLYGVEVTGATGGTTFPTGASLYEMLRWPGIQSKLIPAGAINNGDRAIYKIGGTYEQGTALRSIVNDADYQRWTATGSTPQYNEVLKFWICRAPFSKYYGDYGGVNFHLSLTYETAWKDLKTAAYYPVGGTNISLSYPLDTLQQDGTSYVDVDN